MSADTEQDLNSSRAPMSQKGQQVTPSGGDAAGYIGGLVSVNIDGKDHKVPLGTTILEAARQIGIKIPTLCTIPTSASRACAGCAWWRSRTSGRCRPPVPTL